MQKKTPRKRAIKKRPKKKKAVVRTSVRKKKNARNARASAKPVHSAKKKDAHVVSEQKITKEESNRGVIDKYELVVDGAHVRTEITHKDEGTVYNLYIPEVSPATSTFLDEISKFGSIPSISFSPKIVAPFVNISILSNIL